MSAIPSVTLNNSETHGPVSAKTSSSNITASIEANHDVQKN